jgi:hypothetical protein
LAIFLSGTARMLNAAFAVRQQQIGAEAVGRKIFRCVRGCGAPARIACNFWAAGVL